MSPIGIRLKPGILSLYNLPDILYSISFAALDNALGEGGDWSISSMLFELQIRAREGDVDWQSLEPAMVRLAQILAPDDLRPIPSASGANWWVEIDAVDLGGPVVTIQRNDKLVAALCATDSGRLRVDAYRPLDAKSATYITGLAARPHPEHGVCMRENNWEYALDCSAGNGNFYAYMRGEAYLSYWENGIGLVSDGTQNMQWLAMRKLRSRPPADVLAELETWDHLSPA